MAVPRSYEVRFQDITVAGNVSVSDTSLILNDLIPSPTESQDLGSSTLRWRKIWAQDIDLSGSSLILNRFVAGGTALTSANFALGSGWGTTAAISAVSGHDSAWKLTITAGGAGITTLPTLTLTFADGAWVTAPFAISKMVSGTGFRSETDDVTSTTTWTMTFNDLPVAGDTYVFRGIAIG